MSRRLARRTIRVALAGSFLVTLAACGNEREAPAQHRVAGGDIEEGRRLIADYGCGSCHRIPGVAGARGVVAQPLENFGARSVLAGIMENRPHNLIAWLQDPPAFRPRTAMPDLGVSEAEARHMAAYLLSLGAEEIMALPPEPRLVPAPPDTAARQRAREREVLESYAWVDRPRRIARIPIERAMEKLLEDDESTDAGE